VTAIGAIRNEPGTVAVLLVVHVYQALQGIAARQAAGDDSSVNLKGIPRLTDRQLAAMVRFRDVRPRKRAVSVRLDERVLVWLKSKGPGHLTLINDILANLMEAELKAVRDR
jgi:uncharacterized protein (DUF4415 family)